MTIGEAIAKLESGIKISETFDQEVLKLFGHVGHMSEERMRRV